MISKMIRYFINYILLVILIFAIFALAGCAPTLPILTPPFNQKITWEARKDQLQALENFEVRGKLAVDSASQHFSASFIWKQEKEHYALRLFGPMGMGMIKIKGDASSVTLQTSDKTIENTDPNRLFKKALGVTLPITELHYWIRSLPSPKSSRKLSFDAYYHLQQLSQDRWDIEYLDYSGIKNLDLPITILAKAEAVTIKLSIQQWKILCTPND